MGVSIAQSTYDDYVSNGNSYFINTEYEKAAKEYEKAIAIKPKELKILSRLAHCYFYLNDLYTSLDYLKKISAINDKYSELHFRMGYIYESLEEYDNAIGEYRKAIMYNDNKPEAFYGLGIVYGKMGDLRQSIRKLRQAVKLGKNKAEIRYLIASSFDRLGHLKEAISEYLTTYKMDKNYVQVFYQIGVIKKQQYKYKEAVNYFNKFMNLSKKKSVGAELYLEARDQIKNLKKIGLPKGKYLTYKSDNFDTFNYKMSFLDEFTAKEKKFQGKIIAEFVSLLGSYKMMVSMLPMKKEETVKAAYLRGWGIDITKKGKQENTRVRNFTSLEARDSRKFDLVISDVEEGKAYNDYLTSVIFVHKKGYDRALFEIQIPTRMIPRGILNKAILTFKFI